MDDGAKNFSSPYWDVYFLSKLFLKGNQVNELFIDQAKPVCDLPYCLLL